MSRKCPKRKVKTMSPLLRKPPVHKYPFVFATANCSAANQRWL